MSTWLNLSPGPGPLVGITGAKPKEREGAEETKSAPGHHTERLRSFLILASRNTCFLVTVIITILGHDLARPVETFVGILFSNKVEE